MINVFTSIVVDLFLRSASSRFLGITAFTLYSYRGNNALLSPITIVLFSE